MPEAYRNFVNNVGMERALLDDIAAWLSDTKHSPLSKLALTRT